MRELIGYESKKKKDKKKKKRKRIDWLTTSVEKLGFRASKKKNG